MSLYDAFRAGGWPMWPILFVGAGLLAAAVRYAQQATPVRRAALHGLAVVTGLLGVMGTVLGVIATLMGVAPHLPEKAYLCLIGLGESLNNLSFALILLVVAAGIKVVGDVRAAQSPPRAAGNVSPLPPNL